MPLARARDRGGRCRAGRRRRSARCRPGCPGRRSSRRAPRGCAGRRARRAPAARCRRTSRRPRTSGQQLAGDVAPDRLEAALGVAEPGAQRAVQQQVVAARDDLALGPAQRPGAAGEPGPDGEVGVSAEQGGDQGEQRVEVGGQVDVHVDQDRRGRATTTPASAPGRGPSRAGAPPGRRRCRGRCSAGGRPGLSRRCWRCRRS